MRAAPARGSESRPLPYPKDRIRKSAGLMRSPAPPFALAVLLTASGPGGGLGLGLGLAPEKTSVERWNTGIPHARERDPAPSSPSSPPAPNPRYPDLPLDRYLASPYFHRINASYPGLQLVHEEPYIFVVNGFLTDDECDRLVAKAEAGGEGGWGRQVGGGPVVRTSGGVVCEDGEVPSIRRKMMDLAAVSNPRQLQGLKISRYLEGQEFSKHTDAWPTEGAPVGRGWVEEDDFFGDRSRPTRGCISSLGRPNHNNFMTALVYLNDIPSGRGGCTTFPNIGIHTGRGGGSFYEAPVPLDARERPDGTPWDWDYGKTLRIHPQKGMALLHFCSLVPEHGGICDANVMHQAERPDPGQEKFVCQQFFASCPEWELPDDSLPVGRVSANTI